MENKNENKEKNYIRKRFIIRKHKNFKLISKPTLLNSPLDKNLPIIPVETSLDIVSEESSSKKDKRNFKDLEINENDTNSRVGNSLEKYNLGRWTDIEHKRFLIAILLFGNEWTKVQNYIKTRSSSQARSHAQKFFIKLKDNLKNNQLYHKEQKNIMAALNEIKKSSFFLFF